MTLRSLLLSAALALSVIGTALAQGDLRFAVAGLRVEGDSPLTDAEAQAVLAPFAGPEATIDRLQAAAAALEEAIKARGFGFVRVVVPPQDTGGVITLRVLAFRLGEVAVRGNAAFSEANVRASLPALRPGESPNLREIARDQALANEHPAKQVNVTMRQGASPDTVDAEVAVRDQAPLRFFGSLANTGSHQTGWWRAAVGVQHSNLFDLDHALTASYVSSPEHWSDVKQYGLFYNVPLYGLNAEISAYHSYSNVRSGTIAGLFNVSGRGRFSGLRWKQHLLPRGAYSDTLEAGFEDRYFINDVTFANLPIGVNVRSRPVALVYSARYDYAGGQWRAALEYARNTGGGQDNTDAAYAANRADADRRWQALRFSFDAQHALGGWIGGLRLRGQAAGEPLIPGEQFGFGGAAGVRGLREREVVGDYGLTGSLELTSPELAQGLRALGFIDAGQARLRGTEANVDSRTGSWSAGAGLRWTLERRLTVSLDYAHVMNRAVVTPKGEDALLFSLAVQF